MATATTSIDIGPILSQTLKQYLGSDEYDFITSNLILAADPLFLFAAGFFLALGDQKTIALLLMLFGVIIEVVLFFIKKDKAQNAILNASAGKLSTADAAASVKEFIQYLRYQSYTNIAVVGVCFITGFASWVSKPKLPYTGYYGGGNRRR